MDDDISSSVSTSSRGVDFGTPGQHFRRHRRQRLPRGAVPGGLDFYDQSMFPTGAREGTFHTVRGQKRHGL
eukprot:5754629-Pyramimonas_sp.AAC.1